MTEAETQFLGTATPVTGLRVRSLPAARNSQPYRNRRACAGNTSCIPICPIQAKYDATITLNEATNNGAQLIDHAVASEILVENGSGSAESTISNTTRRADRRVDCVIKAKIYVIAANGIETPRLLLMSRNQNRQWRRQQQRHGRTQSDGPPAISHLGTAAGPRYFPIAVRS